HCAVFEEDGQYFMAHQGRPGVNSFYMVLHVRKIFWLDNGWRVVSPERYAAAEQSPVTIAEVQGAWEQILLNYQVVPGYANEQVSPNFQLAVPLQLDKNGTINGDPAQHWTLSEQTLTLEFSDATYITQIERGRD